MQPIGCKVGGMAGIEIAKQPGLIPGTRHRWRWLDYRCGEGGQGDTRDAVEAAVRAHRHECPYWEKVTVTR